MNKKMRLFNKQNKQILKQRIAQDPTVRQTVSFYRYVTIKSPKDFRNKLFMLFREMDILGRIYIASEGINAQISVPADQKEIFVSTIEEQPELCGIRLNWAIENNSH